MPTDGLIPCRGGLDRYLKSQDNGRHVIIRGILDNGYSTPPTIRHITITDES